MPIYVVDVGRSILATAVQTELQPATSVEPHIIGISHCPTKQSHPKPKLGGKSIEYILMKEMIVSQLVMDFMNMLMT